MRIGQPDIASVWRRTVHVSTYRLRLHYRSRGAVEGVAFRHETIEADDDERAIAQAVSVYSPPVGMELGSAILTTDVGRIIWSINPTIDRNQSRFDTGGSSPLEG